MQEATNSSHNFDHNGFLASQGIPKLKIIQKWLKEPIFQQEPPPPDHPQLDFENEVVSPHNAGITEDANLYMVISAIDQWAQVFGGQRPKNLVNPDAWDKFQGRYNEFFGSSDAN